MALVFFDMNQFDIAQHVDAGCFYMQHNMFKEAIAEFEYVLRLDPRDKYARWGRVLARLALGDYVNGFSEHDCAWRIHDWRSLGPVQGNVDRILVLPVWSGERCKVIAYHEMGVGDAIMLIRFLPELVSRCESVTLVVRPEAIRLMQGYGATVVGSVPEDMSVFDTRVTLFNSMPIMGHSLETIPNKPYLNVDFKFAGGKMGIAWSGNSRHEFPNAASFLSRLDTQGFELFAIQKSEPIDGIVQMPSQDFDFLDTAKLMASMDCIVTVDTSTAHLAGAMGHPNAHLVIPYVRDWRWWHKDTWYPTLNVYPQDSSGDWNTTFQRMNKAIHNG